MERLDEILPDLNGHAEKAEESDAVVVSFDPDRGRQRQPERASAAATSVSPRGASRAALGTARVPAPVAPDAARRPARLPEPEPVVAKSRKGWIWIAVAIAVLVTIVLVVLRLP
jgi:hypothetical protein